MPKNFSFLAFLLVFCIGFSGCSKDDDPEDNSSSSLTVNGIKVGKFYHTLCEITTYPSYLGGGKELALEAQFVYADEGIISYDMGVESITSLSQLKPGMDLTDDIEIYKFYSMTGIIIASHDYEVLSGSAKIESVSSKAVVVRFSKFKFLREIGNNEEEFTINGTISYTIND